MRKLVAVSAVLDEKDVPNIRTVAIRDSLDSAVHTLKEKCLDYKTDRFIIDTFSLSDTLVCRLVDGKIFID